MDHNGHCQHICTDLRFGYKCSCHSGYQLAEDQRSCDGNNGHLTEQYVYNIKFSIKPFIFATNLLLFVTRTFLVEILYQCQISVLGITLILCGI